ncbi:MAG: TlpA family protein disulfide reductase [Burkholderiales bacterium]|nr:TlpA family protein disulfide reductase [Burkholderiales bacterium]
MKKIIAAILFVISTSAAAGFLDLYNGVTLGLPLPEHDFQYLSPPLATKNTPLLLIDFWATWCEPCRVSIPKLNALQQKFSPQGLQIIGISQETKTEVLPFLARIPMHYPTAVEGKLNLHKALGVKALPYAIFVDKKGIIIWRGQPSEINDELIEELLIKQKALGER